MSTMQVIRNQDQRITVEVNGSKVILIGTVRSWVEKEEAGRRRRVGPALTASPSFWTDLKKAQVRSRC